MDTHPQIVDHARTLIHILHTLPVERVEQVVDFARFLQWQELAQQGLLHEDETEEEVLADNERWDATFAASRNKLRRLVHEAREEIRAGRTMEMVFTDDGTIAPESSLEALWR